MTLTEPVKDLWPGEALSVSQNPGGHLHSSAAAGHEPRPLLQPTLDLRSDLAALSPKRGCLSLFHH